MAEVNAKDLTTKTAPASTDSMLLFGTSTNEGAKITVDNLANNILERLTTKTFANQVGGSSAATILAQLATLNSNIGKLTSSTNIVGGYTGKLTGRSARGVLWLLSTNQQRTGMYTYIFSSAGTAAYITPILTPQNNITVTSTNGVISIINATTSDYVFLYVTAFGGDLPTVEIVANT